jgi:hypothetical protein
MNRLVLEIIKKRVDSVFTDMGFQNIIYDNAANDNYDMALKQK